MRSVFESEKRTYIRKTRMDMYNEIRASNAREKRGLENARDSRDGWVVDPARRQNSGKLKLMNSQAPPAALSLITSSRNDSYSTVRVSRRFSHDKGKLVS